MVHQYKNNGYDIVLDVNSGAIHVVDDVTYDVIEMIDQSQPESYARDEIVSALSGKYGKEEVEEAVDEVQTLIDEESLLQRTLTKTISWISKNARRLSRHSACI